MTIRLRHIEALQAVQKAGSITGAAELLNVSQPAVSKLLRHAEDQLGLRLFERVKGKLVPTREAKLLEVEIDRTFAGLERISSIAANLRRGREGHVRIACLPSLGFGFMTEQMAQFHRRHPGVSFDLRTHHTREILELIATNSLDLAIAYEPVLPPGMRKTAIGTSRLVHLSTAPLRPGEAAEITLDRIDVETLIGVDPDTSIGATLSDAFARAGIRYAPKNLIQTYYLALPLVRYGAGSAIVDEHTAQAWAVPDVTVRAIVPEITLPITALHHENYPLSHAAHLFLDHLTGKPTQRTRSARR
ncbi:LysR family transcriptional regulator [Inquilinus limosus]|uniref:LysR family transcriptional regulator n=1 Tax=Inquilinus limosus TaxID=171674 RepID=UPI000415597D|nr:LysR substrate-binding domain-containing protein [Inquilinus limosus]